MRNLTIAGLVMVTAITATPAEAQRNPSNGQGWQNGRAMPPPAVVPSMPASNSQPGVTWNRTGPGPHVAPPATVSPNPPFRNGPDGRRWSGNRQWSGNGQWSGNRQWSGGNRGNHGATSLPGYRPVQPGTRPSRWGGSVGGRWYAGSNAPGGWKAYRRPDRGWTLPRYWIAPSFFIGNYGLYGLSSPPVGYNWTRYYDDAVLTDSYGRVYDSVGGIDWDSYDDGYGYGDDYAYGGGDDGYASGGDGYGARYAPPPVQYTQGPPPQVVQGGYTQTYSSGYAGSGGYASGGYWYPPATTTTITVQSAPVVTTTTTEYIETTYRPVRRVYKAAKRTWRPKSKIRCACN
ncbi:RcnB family protein [Sphingomonas sp. QA11]|uniref:RcnB family protein n=1 Tax=Sphingomonas sp. QA11 TaxID=2950605 RepID=UPI00234AFDB9|nr:RcnB family protein [Sphingomonas sp. QA11]WCM27800.1 RcnB family protein [Sphingomonas sp. QA11]